MNRDPTEYKGSPWNLYEYVLSNPVYYIDPSGLTCEQVDIKGQFGDWHAGYKRYIANYLTYTLEVKYGCCGPNKTDATWCGVKLVDSNVSYTPDYFGGKVGIGVSIGEEAQIKSVEVVGKECPPEMEGNGLKATIVVSHLACVEGGLGVGIGRIGWDLWSGKFCKEQATNTHTIVFMCCGPCK